MGLQSELLLRTLVTFRHVSGAAGLVPVADLATNTGEVSPDGMSWTFHLKDGVRFGPPVNRPITSADIEYAFRRIDTASLNPELGTYGAPPSTSAVDTAFDGVVEGMAGGLATMPDDISGIDSSDPRTVVFHLSRPEGAFPFLLTLPATAPAPPEVAGCFRKAGGYGRDVVSTGPYIIEGADEVDASSCRSLSPMPGFLPTGYLHLVRNPNYDPATDERAVRENFPDRIDIEIDTNSNQILWHVDRGRLDSTLGSISPHLPFPPDLRSLASHWEPVGTLEYLSMNVLVPPFDDVHVRRAVNLALDRNAILWALGVNARGPVTSRLFPTALAGSEGPELFPPGGDLAAAKREMAMSPYDTNGDGLCDSDACRNLFFPPPTTPPEVNAVPILQSNLAAVGIVLKVRELDCMCPYGNFPKVMKNLLPLSFNRALEPLYPDPEAIAGSLDSSGIRCENQINYSEVGISERQARRCGVESEYRKVRDNVPNLDSRIDGCEALSGDARAACWVDFDRYVMADVVPWAPLRFPDTLIVTGKTVTNFVYDQAFGMISLCHVAVSTAAA